MVTTRAMSSLVLVDKPRPHVAQVTLNAPDRLNAMSFALVEALYAALDRVGRDNDAWVVVLTGAGRAFCAGLDLEDKAPPPGSEGMGLPRLAMRAMGYMSGVVPAMRNLQQPVIAAVNGPAYGGGMCMTLGSDIRIAGESAVFCGAGVLNGLTASELGVTYLLPRAIGTSNASWMLLTGAKVGAAKVQLGSSSEVPLVAPRNLAVTVPAGLSTGAIQMKIRYNGPLVAPIAKGQEVAELVVTTGDTPPQVVPLVAGEEVGRAGFFGRIWLGFKQLFGMA